MEQNNDAIAIVHLIWIPYGTELFKNFIQSYKKFDAGCQHELILLFNGVDKPGQAAPYHELASNLGLEYKSFYLESGQDIDAYFWIAGNITAGSILFLNSFSEIRSANWLAKYVSAASRRDCGVISATASNQSHYSLVFQKYPWTYESQKGWQYNFRKYKLFLKAIFYWRFLFKPFPNPHIRTNAFFISRLLLLSVNKPVIKDKMDAYKFESGKHSFTNQVLAKGLNAFVIDCNGDVYGPGEWHLSKTFWSEQQQNLLIADNQTIAYEKADDIVKRKMAASAWGKHE